ncbi:putative exosome complex component rrp40 [Phoenix dactylifera]|uniref:Exosome complex component rrp40 n=1 Tax=Phoenix dactylifera TaxID=42345 RepID=A0A8B8J975_PHODC|nr:putative exosome complex component rrp40 [Phoenix dactylifera]
MLFSDSSLLSSFLPSILGIVFLQHVPCVEDTVLGIVVDSKPDVGTLLYARMVKANNSMNPELSCTDASGETAEFGPLKDGYMFETSSGLSRMLLSSPTCPVIEILGKKLSFEIAIGLNGRVWVNASSPATVVVSNAIINSEFRVGLSKEL